MKNFELNINYTINGIATIKADSLEAAIEIANKGIEIPYIYPYPVGKYKRLIDVFFKENAICTFSEKSPQASLVLRLMDNDFTYEQSIKATLVAYPDCDQAELLKELENYI